MGSAAIPLQVQPVQVASPIQSIGRLMQLKSGMADIALKQQQEKQAEQQTALIDAEQQQKNRDLADQNTIQELMKDPTVGPKIAAGDTNVLLGKVQPKTLDALNTTLTKLHSDKATAAKSDLELSNVALGRLTQALSGLQTTFGDDIGKINEALPSTIASLDSQGVFKDAGIDSSQLPKAISDPKDLNRLAAQLGIAQALNDKALERKGVQATQAKTEADTAKALADKANLEAQNPGIVADAAAKVAQLPVTEAVAADTLANPKHLTPEKQAEVDRAAAQLAETKLHNRNEEALARSKETREQHIYEQTYGEGANQALVGVEPKLRTAATSAAQKAANDYQDAQRAADDIKTFVDAARSGNKIAYSYLPTEGVLTLNTGRGIKRVNMAEIQSYGGAGSALDRLQGFLGKQVSGASIPPDLLNDIENIHAAVQQNAVKGYNAKLEGINQNYHANFKPVPGGEAKPAAAASGAHRIKVGNKLYDYKGSGDTADLNNYTEVKP
jgi:hypothetical protein